MKGGRVHSTRYRGTVRGLQRDWDNERAVRVDIEPVADAKAKKQKGPAAIGPTTRTEVVASHVASSLSVGDEVEVVTMFRKLGD